MKKISTLFKKNPENLALVINEINPENQWVIDEEGLPTRKYDGTAAAIINGILYKRYDVKKGKQVPENAIPCQEPDEITGHWPHWVKCEPSNPEDKYFFEGIKNLYCRGNMDGTYELCGPKINKNREGFKEHILVRHRESDLWITDYTFDGLKNLLSNSALDIEGIVWHHPDGRMCKLRKSDFGIKR